MTSMMISGEIEKMKSHDSTDQLPVCIIGPAKLQNALMAQFLEKRIGTACGQAQILSEINLDENGTNIPQLLILWDCQHLDSSRLWKELDRSSQSLPRQRLIALFNVGTDQGIEKEALQRGIRGIFYKTDPMERLSNGVLAIIRGELWFSRKIMSEVFLERTTGAGFFGRTHPSLTRRESEMLMEIASGATNKEIAEELGISIHTVKTHLYNTYRKINVSNRLQAVLREVKNLESLKK